jgi:hypothetical protein
MLFHFLRTSFADATGPLDSNVAAGPSSIRMHGLEHVSQRVTRFAPVVWGKKGITLPPLNTQNRNKAMPPE